VGWTAIGGATNDAGTDDPDGTTPMDTVTSVGCNGNTGSWCDNVEDPALEEDPGMWLADRDSRTTSPAQQRDQVRDLHHHQKSRVSEAQRELDQHLVPHPKSASCSVLGCTTSSMALFLLGSALILAEFSAVVTWNKGESTDTRKNMHFSIGFIY
jgi:hypothetical protein